MKDNLEKAFKNSLEDYQAPYDPKAWESVNAKLDAKTSGGSSFSSTLKWALATVLLGTFVAGAYLLWFDEEKAVRQEITMDSKEVNSKGNKERSEENEKLKPEEFIKTEETQEKQNGEKETSDIIEKEKEEPLFTEVQENESSVVTEAKDETENSLNDEDIVSKKSVVHKEKAIEPVETYIPGLLSKSKACKGESIVVNNSSGNKLVRFFYDGREVILKPGQTFDIEVDNSFEINFIDNKGNHLRTKVIKVHEPVQPDFSLEANLFEKGLPVVIAEAYGDYKSYAWEFDGKVVKRGEVAKHNFFDKGDYNVVLKVRDENGCEGMTVKTARIRNKFNLMAVDAFKPNGSDVRNKTFMPYSLTERDVRFQLTIIDPSDNGIVFSSKDANNAWNGEDQRTGELTPSNKTYIWKVQIFNPAPNERPIYAGTVVHN